MVAAAAVPGPGPGLPEQALGSAPGFAVPDAEQPVLEAARPELPGPRQPEPGPGRELVLGQARGPGQPAEPPAQLAGLRMSDRSRPAAR